MRYLLDTHTQVQAEETNTKYAQGGIAAVWAADDSFEKHIDDRLQLNAHRL